MDRISTATKAVDLFGAGKHGFKDGNLGIGVAPTDFNAEWFNGVQEELLNVIQAAGTVPEAGTRNQLLASLSGALASRPDMARSFGTNGYQKFPGGLILQWVTYASTADSTITVTLPIAFPVYFLGACVTARDNIATVSASPVATALPLSLSTFSLRSYYTASGIVNFVLALGY